MLPSSYALCMRLLLADHIPGRKCSKHTSPQACIEVAKQAPILRPAELDCPKLRGLPLSALYYYLYISSVSSL